MKSGFKKGLDKNLRIYGLKTSEARGGSLVGPKVYTLLGELGYHVEKGIDNPPYDYIVLSRKNSGLLLGDYCLTKLNAGGILMYIMDYGEFPTFGFKVKKG